jgi:hypothetical protein
LVMIGRRALVRCAVLLALAACHPNYDHPMCGDDNSCPRNLMCNPTTQICEDTGTGNGIPDAMMTEAGDGPTMPADARVCFGTGLVKVCLTAAPTQPRAFTAATSLDTGNANNCTQVFTQTGGPDLCVIAGTTVTITSTFIVTGSRALVLIGADSVTVTGTGSVDVSSTTNSNPRRVGAAANSSLCNSPSNPENDNGGGGGGGGGSFGTKGGDGGTGDLNNNGTPMNGSAKGGSAGLVQPAPVVLRGGCRGGAGGDADNQHRGGAGGDGGGAVYLIAGRLLTIGGDVSASGAGGVADPNNGGTEQGGGGGGTGGMIGLDAPMITVSGHIAANGGGGGGGGGLNTGGTPGGDGTVGASWDQRAAAGAPGAGGGGTTAGGAPGTAVNQSDNIIGPSSDGGAGGGGGGLGVIWIDGALNSATMMISPAPTSH